MRLTTTGEQRWPDTHPCETRPTYNEEDLLAQKDSLTSGRIRYAISPWHTLFDHRLHALGTCPDRSICWPNASSCRAIGHLLSDAICPTALPEM